MPPTNRASVPARDIGVGAATRCPPLTVHPDVHAVTDFGLPIQLERVGVIDAVDAPPDGALGVRRVYSDMAVGSSGHRGGDRVPIP